MHISYRPALLADIECCLDRMLPSGFRCEPDVLAALPKLWRDWVLKGTATMVVVEARDPSGVERIIGFGFSLFVSDAFTASIRASEVAPPIAASVARLALAGRSPVLSPVEVRRVNSAAGGGLNLLSPVIGWLPEIEPDPRLLVMVKANLLEALINHHAGYKLHRFLQELHGEAERQRAETIGASLYTDYSRHYGGHPPAPEERACVVGLERETIQESSTLWPLFFYAQPIIYFSPLEQEVLRLAVGGLTDPQITDALALSRSAVHKRWHSLLRRAMPHVATWMPASLRGSLSETGRGAEKRHSLLNYLKSHPEELRPVERPTQHA